jgi:hypothetical protein
MLQEALEWLSQQAEKAKDVKILDVPGDASHLFRLMTPDGRIATFSKDPQARSHEAFSLETVTTLALRFSARFAEDAARTEAAKTSDLPAIWYNRDAIVCLLDDETRRDRVHFRLRQHPAMRQLCEWTQNAPPDLDQRSFVRLLKITFAGCLGKCEGLLDAVRTVRFAGASNSESVVQQGKSSTGKSVRAEIAGADRFPEYVTIDCPIWINLLAERRYSVVCSLDVDAGSERFKLTPLPGAVEKAIQMGEEDIHWHLGDQLDKEKILSDRIYYGAP